MIRYHDAENKEDLFRETGLVVSAEAQHIVQISV